MSAEDDPLKVYRDRIAASEPLAQFVIQAPIRISVTPSGAVQFDSPMGIAGIDEAAIQRVLLMASPEMLRAALEEIESKDLAFVELRRAQPGH